MTSLNLQDFEYEEVIIPGLLFFCFYSLSFFFFFRYKIIFFFNFNFNMNIIKIRLINN